MFKELSAIKNSPITTMMMIQYALMDVTKIITGSIIPGWDILRIMVHNNMVTITLVDKHSMVSLYKDIMYEFTDDKITSNYDDTRVYRIDGYRPR